MRGPKPKPLLARVATLVNGPLDPERCWPWKGALTIQGLPVVRHGKTQAAHKALFCEVIQPLEPGQRLTKGCDGPICVNPHHWQIAGTRAPELQAGPPPVSDDEEVDDCVFAILNRTDRNTDGLPFSQAVIDQAFEIIVRDQL